MSIAIQQREFADPLVQEGIWMFKGERCSAKHFRTGETANLVAQEFVTWMKEIFPNSRWEVDELRPGTTGNCFPTVIDTTERDVFDRTGEKIGWELLRGSVMTNEKGVPVGVLVCSHDGLEGVERFFTIDGRLVGEQSVGW